MTVCIGALCDNEHVTVLAADEMVTFGPPMNLQTEPPGLKKIVTIASSAALLYSGGVADGEEIYFCSRGEVGSSGYAPGGFPSMAARSSTSRRKRKYHNHGAPNAMSVTAAIRCVQ